MKKRNLQRMANHIRTVPQEMFDMSIYRKDNTPTRECNTVGCVIGHCIILGKPIYYEDNESQSGIDYTRWAIQFTGLWIGSDLFRWCFSERWRRVDNTPEGAALRIEWIIKNDLPENWTNQMFGLEPLCYLPANK